MPTYVGLSETIEFAELREIFDINMENPEKRSDFDVEFSSGYIDPGGYEVYGKKHFKDYEFTPQFIARLFPFHLDGNVINMLVDRDPVSMFFVITENVITKRYAIGIEIIAEVEAPLTPP